MAKFEHAYHLSDPGLGQKAVRLVFVIKNLQFHEIRRIKNG